MESGRFEHNGTTLHYDIAGQGAPLVFIHAGIADRRMWDEQVGFFADRFRVYRYDMRGFGETAVSPNDFSNIDDLHALFAHWEIGRAHLVGCSMGGQLAMDFALEHPDRVRSVAMVCSVPSGYPFSVDPSPQWDKIVTAYRAGDIEMTNILEATYWVDGIQREPEPAREAIRSRILEMNGIALNNQVNGNGGKAQAATAKAYDRYDQFTAPLLVITGRYDEPELAEIGRFMLENHPNAQSAVFDAAHVPNMEHPNAFNKRLLEFLDTNND